MREELPGLGTMRVLLEPRDDPMEPRELLEEPTDEPRELLELREEPMEPRELLEPRDEPTEPRLDPWLEPAEPRELEPRWPEEREIPPEDEPRLREPRWASARSGRRRAADRVTTSDRKR